MIALAIVMKLPMSILRTAGLVGACVAMLSWQNSTTQAQKSTFRARTDLLTLDVTVLDQNRRPVTGLTADDFVILDDGKPQVVAALRRDCRRGSPGPRDGGAAEGAAEGCRLQPSR